MEALRRRAAEIIANSKNTERASQHPRGGRTLQDRRKVSAIDKASSAEWRARWQREAAKGNRPAVTWKEGWESQPLHLYDDLQKHEATALLLLRTEVLGLNDWLARIGVPDINPSCPCGAQRQTIQHLVGFCPNQIQARATLVRKTGSTALRMLLSEKASAKAAARWLLDTRTMEHLRVAVEIEEEETGDWAPFELT